MAKCSICGKKAISGHNRSHSNIATKRRFKPNIQSKVINGKKVQICASCLRTINKID